MLFSKKKKYRSKPAFLSSEDIKLTFCITSKNRFEYLKKTLGQNLLDNEHHTNVDFVLVDFGEDLSVAQWVKTNFKERLADESLKVFHCAHLPEWHASKAKNCAHALANGDIVANLDCDNFTGKDGGKFIIDQFVSADSEIVLWQNSGKKRDGTYGRIALTKATFVGLGGYDESFLPMGFQDGDLLDRARVQGIRIVKEKDPRYTQALNHEKYVPKDMTWKKMNEHNERTSRLNIRQGKLVANGGQVSSLVKLASRIE